jgi:hypothetical protein
MTQHNEISQLGSTNDTQQITTFVDDVNIETYEKPMMSSVTAWTKIAEDEKLHDIHAVLKRPVNVKNGVFSVSFSSLKLKFPDVILQTSKNVVKKLDYFTYFRANVKIRLVFNATPFQSGKYWMFFAPYDAVSNRSARLASLPNCTGYPGVEIDLASNAPAEIKIPYCAPLSHYNLIDTHSNMGEMFLIPLNPIRMGTDTVTDAVGATFSIFAWFEDIELAMPTSLPVTVPEEQQGELIAQVGKSEEHSATSGPSISGMAGAVATASSALGNIPMLGPWVRPVEWVSRAVEGVASTFGWNKPTNLDKNCPYSNITAKGYTNADGIDLSTKLGAMPDNGLTYDSGLFSTDIDEMDIKYVAAKSCIYADNINWDLNSQEGELLHHAPVTPGITTGSATNMEPTTLAYLASMFRYWRGGLRFRLTVAKTAFHTGRLRITYNPGVYGVDSSMVLENAYNWILDLSVSSELEFTIPYVSNVPWKETLVNPFNNTFWTDKEQFSTGIITVTVLTPLRRASDVVSSDAPINMWLSGDDDVSFAIPDFSNYFVLDPTQADVNLTAEEAEELKAQVDAPDSFTRWHECTYCGRIIDWEENPYCYADCPGPLRAQVFNLTQPGVEHNEQVSDDSQNMFPKSNMSTTTAEELCMGEKITNLRQLCKRFAPTTLGYSYPYKTPAGQYAFPGPIPLNNDNYLFNQIEIDPAFMGIAGTDAISEQSITLPVSKDAENTITEAEMPAVRKYWSSNPLHRVSYLFRFYRGGKRYKVLNPVTNGVKIENGGLRTAQPKCTARSPYQTAHDTVTFESNRPAEPIFAVRDWQVVENGTLENTKISAFTTLDQNPQFKHRVYPDVNGVLEFEVPYYGQMPISLVGEGTLSSVDGPLVRRSKIYLRRNHDPKGLDRPLWNFCSDEEFPHSTECDPGINRGNDGGHRGAFGGFTLYEAAADDFSFGYLVGAPKLKRLQQPLS